MESNVLSWLLEVENPSVRCFTLKDILGRSESDPQVIESRRQIMLHGPVPRILEARSGPGFWGEADNFYTDKYTGTVWNLLLMAELGADGSDPRIQEAVEFLLSNSQEPVDGGFSYRRSAKLGGGLPSGVVPCLTGNMVYSLIRLGYLQDTRVQQSIRWITAYQRCDDGDSSAPKGGFYDRYEMCWGRHSCHMGVAKALKALAALPPDHRSEDVRLKIDELVEYFLRHHIHRKSHHLEEVARPGWLKPGFPLMYQTDIFELLDILTVLGVQDPRMDEALAVLRGKQRPDGTWKLENTFNGKMLVEIEKKGAPSKWLTLRALRILKALKPAETEV